MYVSSIDSSLFSLLDTEPWDPGDRAVILVTCLGAYFLSLAMIYQMPGPGCELWMTCALWLSNNIFKHVYVLYIYIYVSMYLCI